MRLQRMYLVGILMAGPPALLSGQEPGPPTAFLVSGPELGAVAPDFALPWATADSTGPVDRPFRLSEQRGRVVVLAFYPRDFTAGCTAELRTFTSQYQVMFGPEVVVVGISVDSLATHQRFAQSLGLPFPLLSDPSQRVARLYGSAGTGETMRRTVYVLDRQGKVAYRDLRFGAVDPNAYRALREAVRTARN